jgi:hypothetical protein
MPHGLLPGWETFMTPEERQMLSGLFERVQTVGQTARDPEAEAFIGDAMRAQPHAPYVLAQTVLVQQQALEAAARRVQELEAQAKAAPPQETSFLGSLGKSLFGGSAPAPAPRPAPPPDYQQAQRPAYAPQQSYAPQPQYAPQQQYAPQPGGPWGGAPSGGAPSFLGSALTTAAGVAGGVMLANSLGGLFGGHSGFGGGGFGAGGFGGGGETVVNNYYEDDTSAQHAEDVQQDQDQDQDIAQDASDDYSGGGDDGGSYDT